MLSDGTRRPRTCLETIRPTVWVKRFRKFFASLLGRHPERNEFWALQDISFQLQEGESLGIIGPNGSGKTTLLRLLSGISRINRGHLLVRGTVSALIALGAGFHPELSGRENIYLNASILGLRHRMIRKFFDDIVEFADIGEYIDSPVKRYSSGMFVRLGFAVAAQIRPDILLVDEVLAVGDARFQARCHERIAQLRESGTIIILVSHDLWTVRQSCQQGLYIDHGHIRSQGDIATVIAAYNKQIQTEALARLRKKTEAKTFPSIPRATWIFSTNRNTPSPNSPWGLPPLCASITDATSRFLRLHWSSTSWRTMAPAPLSCGVEKRMACGKTRRRRPH
jgi:ABC-type polysaccharide/polyol phosphate transport system ATPase subunit